MENKNSKMQLFHRLLLPTLIFIIITLYFIEVQGLRGSGNRMLISPIYWIMTGLYPLILLYEWKNWRNTNPKKMAKEDEEDNYEVDVPLSKKVLIFMVSIFLYLVLIEPIGFVIVTLLFLPSLMWLLGTRGWKLLIILPVAVTTLLYILFVTWLGIPLPEGIL